MFDGVAVVEGFVAEMHANFELNGNSQRALSTSNSAFIGT
jgi:hypothetical protein